MRLIAKMLIIGRAFKKVNKSNLIKKVYSAIKIGGINKLKESIVQTAYRNEIIDDIKFNNHKANLYQEQQANEKRQKFEGSSNVTVIVLVPNSDYFLTDTINSIKNQSYSNFDILLLLLPNSINNDSTYETDNSISCCYFHYNFSMSEMVSTVKGKYFILLRAGNVLAPNALYYFVREMDKGYSIAYSDECIWNFENSSIFRHYLKPDFSKYYLYNHLYTEQSVCFNTQDILKLDYFRDNIANVAFMINEGVLKLINEGKKATHIEKILLLRHYHYELLEEVNIRANTELIRKSLNRMGIKTEQESEYIKGYFENNYCEMLKINDVKISIIIPSNDINLVINSINSIFSNTSYTIIEVIVVASSEVYKLFKQSEDIRNNIEIIELLGSFSYAKACNKGMEIATGEISVFMQDNIYVNEKDWLSEIIRCFSFPLVGGVSPKILRNDNTIRYTGAISGGYDFTPIPFNGEYNLMDNDFTEFTFSSKEVSILSASCFAIRSNLFRKLAGFNEIETPYKFSNADLSFGIKEEGYSCIYCANSIVYSNGGDWYDNWFDKPSDTAYIYLLKKWIKELTNDPYFTYSMKKHIMDKLPIDYKVSYKECNINKKNDIPRNILLVSHELSITGAPIALHYAAKTLLDNGDYPVIISPFDGNLRKTIVDDGIPVIVDYSIFGDKIWINLARNFDLVVVSTLVCNNMIRYLEEANIPTIWWAHEAKASFEIGALKKTLPDRVNENIHIFSGGEYARKVLLSYRPAYNVDLLLYAVPDFSNVDNNVEYKINNIDSKIVFSIIGSIMDRKGQDILAKAIMKMPRDIVKRCRFIIVGKNVDATTYYKVKELKDKYPIEVILIDEVIRDELMEIYKSCHCVICASRDDPMPVFMTEAMMFSKICICSENTGTAALLNDGVNGFIYKNNDPEHLMQIIIYVVEHIDNLEEMKKKSRETYETNFTMEAFSNKFISIIDSLISK